jgi:hypothetical protein
MYLVINTWVIADKVSNFSGPYLRNHWTLDIGVLGYIGIVWLKEHSPEVRSFPPGTFCIQLRRRPPEDEQGNVLNMQSILINVLHVNKQEFCASSWRSTKVILRCTVNQSSSLIFFNLKKSYWKVKSHLVMWRLVFVSHILLALFIPLLVCSVLVTHFPSIYFRSYDSCRCLPEPKHHSFLFNHWSASKCLVFMAARTPSIHVFRYSF